MYANQIKSQLRFCPTTCMQGYTNFARSNQIKSNHAKRVKTHSNRLSNEINTRSEAEVPNTWSTIPKVLTMRAQGGNELSPGVGLHAAFRACENVTNRIKEWSITISLHPPTDTVSYLYHLSLSLSLSLCYFSLLAFWLHHCKLHRRGGGGGGC